MGTIGFFLKFGTCQIGVLIFTLVKSFTFIQISNFILKLTLLVNFLNLEFKLEVGSKLLKTVRACSVASLCDPSQVRLSMGFLRQEY